MVTKREKEWLEAGAKRRKSNQNAVQEKKPALYYRSKNDAEPVTKKPKITASRTPATPKTQRTTGRRPVYFAGRQNNQEPSAKPVRTAYHSAKPKPTKKWGVDFGRDFERTQRGERLENETPQGKLKDLNPIAQVKTDAEPGSKYRVRNWINGRIRDYPEDRGRPLAQFKRMAALYGAVEPTTKGYTPEQAQALHREILNAPVDLQNLYINYANRLSPMVDLGAGGEAVLSGPAYFDPKTGRVYGDPRKIASDTRTNVPYRTHWHEYGHNLDRLAGENVRPYRYFSNFFQTEGRGLNQIISDDLDDSLRDYWRKVRLDEQPFDENLAMKELNFDLQAAYPNAYRNMTSLSDMMGQYSLNHGGSHAPLGWGHDEEYWEKSQNAPTEAFANLASASVGGGDALRFVQAMYPETYDAYLKMLAEMANR